MPPLHATDAPDPEELKRLIEAHGQAAAIERLARELDGVRVALDTQTLRLDGHLERAHTIFVAHDRRESAIAQARATVEAKVLAETEAADARAKIAKMETSTRWIKAAGAIGAVIALLVGAYLQSLLNGAPP